MNPLGFLHHKSHANNPHLKVFEKNGKFGVGTDETNVPQFSFGTKAEAEDYIRLAKDYKDEAAHVPATAEAPAHTPATAEQVHSPDKS